MNGIDRNKINNHLISVIIPVYNAEKFVSAAIESVLNQTYKRFEIIVIDDGSIDNTAELVKFFNVAYYYQQNAGVSSALNKGISMAEGDFFAFLDADDIWMPDKLERQMQIFRERKKVDMIFSYLNQVYVNEKKFDSIDIPPIIYSGHHRGTMVIRRKAFFKVGLFNPTLKMGEFIDWNIKAQRCQLINYTLEEVLMTRQIHGENMGIVQRANRVDYLKIVKKHLADKRNISL